MQDHKKHQTFDSKTIAHIKQAHIYCESSRFTEAQQQLMKIKKKHQHSGVVLGLKGLCNQGLNNSEGAIYYFKKALNKSPQNVDIKKRLAQLLFKQKQLIEAKYVFEELAQNEKTEGFGLMGLGAIAENNSNYTESLHINLKLSEKFPDNVGAQINTANSLAKLKGQLSPSTDHDKLILHILSFNAINPELLNSFISTYIKQKYQLYQKDVEIDIDTLLNDKLLRKALTSVLFLGVHLENLTNHLRRSLVDTIIKSNKANPELIDFLVALSHQFHKNEYIQKETELEKKLTNELQHQLTTNIENDQPLKDSELLIVCLSLYKRLIDIPCLARFTDIKNWPERLHSIATECFFNPLTERIIARDIRQITPIDDQVSRNIKSHYEENPYPKWNKVQQPPSITLTAYLNSNLPELNLEKVETDLINILVAGCGTGRLTCELAHQFPNASITAVDMSTASLAYAKRKSQEMGLKNIDFFSGDILNLPDLNKEFQLIDCCGVLHHMKNPMLGWKSLNKCLAKEGVLRIDLYSSTARREITKHKLMIHQLNLQPNRSNIINYRQSILEREKNSSLLSFQDFWNYSEFRDLVFHQQEHQYNWLQIEQCLIDVGMDLLGVKQTTDVYTELKRFCQEKKLDADTKNLRNWHEFEKFNPYLFSGMYSFFCQHKQS